MRVRGYQARTDLARKERRRGKQGSRKDEARAGGASQQSGPFRWSLGPFQQERGVYPCLIFGFGWSYRRFTLGGTAAGKGGVFLGPQFSPVGAEENGKGM